MTDPVEWRVDGTSESPPLHEGWQGQSQWTLLQIADGFPSHFLQAWHAWRQHANRPRLLHCVVLTGHPPDLDELARQISPFPELAPLWAQLQTQGWGLTPGWHRLKFEDGQVILTLCIAPPAETLKELQLDADSVLVTASETGAGALACDGNLLKAIARLCRRGAQLLLPQPNDTVRQALQALGFQTTPAPGPSPWLSARYAPEWTPRRPAKLATAEANNERRSCMVIGAGLAGCATATELARRGWQVQLLDAATEAATGASGLPAGLFCPHFSRDDTRISRLTRTGLRLTREAADRLLHQQEDWNPCGVLEHRVHGKAGPVGTHEATDWSTEADSATKAAAGLPESAPATWHRFAGWLRPARLARALLTQAAPITLITGARVARLQHQGDRWEALADDGTVLAQAFHVVVTAGAGSRLLAGYAVPTQVIRGQLSAGYVQAGDAIAPFPVNGQGSLIPHLPSAAGPQWFSGSSFDRAHIPGPAGTPTPVFEEDHQTNRDKLHKLLPTAGHLMGPDRPLLAWSGLRCTSPDRLPLVGPVDPEHRPGLWTCTALGTRGLTWGLLCAELLVAHMNAEPLPVELSHAKALLANRPAPGKAWLAHD